MVRERKAPIFLVTVLLAVTLLFTACSSKTVSAAEKITLGQKYLTELNYTEAVASFTEAIGLDPENIPAYMGRAQAYVGLEQYDKALEDYAKLAELGVKMSDDTAGGQSAKGENAGGAYVWNYADENGSTQKIQLMVQPGSNQMNAVVEYPSSVLGTQKIASFIVSAKLGSKYPELQEDYEKLQDMNGLAAEIDPQNVSQEQMAKLKAMEEQWSAFENKYGALEEEYTAELNQWAGIDWRPQILESITLSNPISRVERKADTLYIYVPTGTMYQGCEVTFTSYSGEAETVDGTSLISYGAQDPFAKPVYEQENSGATVGSFKIIYREDK